MIGWPWWAWLWCAVSFAAEQPSTTAAAETRTVQTAIVPLVNFTTDRGLGYGGYGAVFYMGPDGPGDAPYRMQLGTQWYRTTGGYQDHKLVLDLPTLADGLVRAELHLGWERWDDAHYFGQGNRLPRLRPSETPHRFYAFGIDSVRSAATVQVNVGGNWSIAVGHLARTATIAVYPGSLLDGERPVGLEGGLLSQGSVGVVHDSRDHEAAPTSGGWSEISLRVAGTALGSRWAMWGGNLTDRRYWSLGSPRVVLASRQAVDVQRGDVPFFHQIVMGGSRWVDIGGPLAMRGLPIGRYRGEWTIYADAELRWEASGFQIGRGHYRLFFVPFVSGARIVEPGEGDNAFRPHGGMGLGTRLLFNDVFQARLDVAMGREEYRTDRATAAVERAWIPGVYLAFNAPY
ncbi:MAG: BamA/TamA family outer membrane protein [Myxococcota bacterium]|nr:BamA/TamA family outer membrane protein [Myxococcota bacterium]